MARILCAKSGIEFNCDHFPIALTSGEMTHPVFNVPLKRLWKYFPKWQADELGDTDSYLYFLALLDATELVQWSCAVYRTTKTNQIVQANMENLFYTIGKIVTIRHPKFAVPRIAISHDTRDLNNVRYWIESWSQAYVDFCNGLKDADLRSRLQRKEQVLEKLIKNPALHPRKYARILASWAADAANFPEAITRDELGNQITISEYWQQIIIKCYNAEEIINIPEVELKDIIEHCEQNMELGSIQSYHLFNTLREGLITLQGFFSIGGTSFSILNDDSDVGQTNLQMLIDSAPMEEPRRIDYPTEFSFMKAKMKYNLAKNRMVDI